MRPEQRRAFSRLTAPEERRRWRILLQALNYPTSSDNVDITPRETGVLAILSVAAATLFSLYFLAC